MPVMALAPMAGVGNWVFRLICAQLGARLVGVEFIKKVRDQEKFDGLDALVNQINQDVDDCRQVLDKNRGSGPEPLG